MVTAQFVLVDLYSLDTAHFVYRCQWSSLWVDISTLAYESNTLLTRKVVSGVLHPYNSEKFNTQNRRYIQNRCLHLF